MAATVRRLAVLLACTLLVAGVVLAVRDPLVDAGAALRAGTLRRVGFEDLLVWVCSAAALPAAACWWVGTLRLVAATRGGATGAAAPHPCGVPAWWRAAVLSACGATLVAVPATATAATTEDPGPAGADLVLALPPDTGDLPATGPGGLPLPDRVSGDVEAPPAHRTRSAAPRAAAPPVVVTPAPAQAVVRVVAGDSLWRIAETHLRGSGDRVPTDAEVSTHWRAIHAANADRIGPDPDHLLPGLRLELPGRPT